jgi:membrane-associated protease RseP (regulator of RpoE activity)
VDDPTVLDGEDEAPPRPRYWTNALLFVATVVSVLLAGATYARAISPHASPLEVLRALPQGAPFALALLGILVTHELAHYVAARIHRVPASLPYFIPLPFFSPTGTMGAVISLPDRIRSRNALFDIGASGPLAGLVVALPLWCIGIATSRVEVLDGPYTQEGQSLVYLALKYLLKGPIPAGSDLLMNPLAFAGWVGALVTMINLVPVGQLDGGHIAYALFGAKQDRYATWLHRALLVAFGYNVMRFGVPLITSGKYGEWSSVLTNSMFWLVWFGLIAGFKGMSGVNHPPTDDETLSPRRRIVGVACLIIFVLLFMPTPWAQMR